ncbi:Bacterial lipid A biosynthesis acyltransferase [Candidatus Magnetobacterium bavaricum]|uniref:Bacterial lipid A biosynthesis acyltransferase n=1 Tax=Candidatus Magnetobacterium bavaricum TaxID=29290 RepID=A0A0F3GXS0_9BACT|nr:Bacterial lipid A biosynthesis acyltransferase [Candidatus Magnetobacterium bavaricum]
MADTAGKKKSRLRWYLEYGAVRVLFFAAAMIPIRVVSALSVLLGNLLYLLVPRRRNIALKNLRNAFADKSETEIRSIARKSCGAFFLTFLETIKYRDELLSPGLIGNVRGGGRQGLEVAESQELLALFAKARAIHDDSGGCIFVTPHIGNWEFLPYVSAVVGIPMVVVVRPLDNPHLQRLIYANRAQSGQLFVAKSNSLFALQDALRHGKSIGMLPDQSTAKGVIVNYFGSPATATPIPAMLSVLYKRPIVVVACCRRRPVGGTRKDSDFTGVVSDPIYPGQYTSEKAEIIRLTEAMTAEMQQIVTAFPEQYLWVHNRWKTYKKENLWTKNV